MRAQDASGLQKEIGELRDALAAARDEAAAARAQRDRLQAEFAHLRDSLKLAGDNIRSLKESEGRYRILSGASLAGVYVIDHDGKLVYANAQAAQMMGYTPEEVIGRRVLDFTAPESREMVQENVRRRLAGEVSSIQYSARILHRDGSLRDWEVFGHRAVFEGKPAIIGTVLDRTEEKRAERALQASEARFQAFMEHTPALAFMRDAEGRFVYANRALHQLLGMPEGAILGKKPHDIFPAQTADIMVATDRETLATGRSVEVTATVHLPGSEPRHMFVLKFPLDTLDGARLVAGSAFDITERVVERGKRERLQALSKELVSVQEAERRRIGLELHDEIGQLLTGLKLKLSVGDRLPPEDLDARLREADQLVDEAIARVRELAQNLRPQALDDLGLLPALVSYFGRYSRQTGVRVQLEHRGVERQRFDPEMETAVYRIVQEALTNVARHAHVGSVFVRAWADEQMLGVQIEDHGPGFDSDAAVANGNTQGLTGMRERAALLRGVLTVDASPGRGCRVTCELPIGDGCRRKEDA